MNTSGATEDGGATSVADSGSTGGPAVDPAEVCVATCEFLVGCEIEDVPNCGIPCTGIGGTVAGCEAEYGAQQQCVVALSCEDAQAWTEGTGRDYPCAAEDMALEDCLGAGSG